VCLKYSCRLMGFLKSELMNLSINVGIQNVFQRALYRIACKDTSLNIERKRTAHFVLRRFAIEMFIVVINYMVFVIYNRHKELFYYSCI
jgi:hypothetical protein